MNSNNYSLEKNKILKLFKEKKFNKVLKLGIKLLKKNSQDFDLLYALGLSAISLQNYSDAEKFLKRTLNLKKTAYIFYIYGNVQSKLKNYTQAIEAFKNALNLNPKFSEAYNNLANAYKLINQIDDAIINYNNSIKQDKKNLTAYFNLAVLFKEKKNYEESKKIYKKILSEDENNLTAKHDIGAIESVLGNFVSARKYFIDSINQNISNFKSFKNYIEITDINKDDTVFKKLQGISVEKESTENQIDIYYSLSKGYFDKGEKKLGFENLEKGKRIKKSFSKFSIKREKNRFKNLVKYFDENTFVEVKNLISTKKIPIFVLGMPRSGTTLIEQILSSHSKVYGAGELTYLPRIVDKVYFKNKINFEDTINNIRSQYLQAIEGLSDKKFILDKLPLNFKWIGFIVKAFPESKIIHLNRNPMAVCWSNYKINFRDTGMEFTLSQEDLGEYYVLYHELMKYWLTRFDKSIINVDYENFVLDYEEYSKKIINKLSLNWEENIKNYNKSVRPVETASLHQVRGKILKNTSEQWRKYKEYLTTTQEILKLNKINF